MSSEKSGMAEVVVRVVSEIRFAQLAENEFVDFPATPPPEAGARPRPAPGEAIEKCPICGEAVLKGTLSAHISECIDSC